LKWRDLIIDGDELNIANSLEFNAIGKYPHIHVHHSTIRELAHSSKDIFPSKNIAHLINLSYSV